MSLRSRFQELYALAARGETPERPGETFAKLAGGATIKVRAHGRRRQVIIGRPGTEVGEIPDDAERADYAAKGWHYVAMKWIEPAGLFDEEAA